MLQISEVIHMFSLKWNQAALAQVAAGVEAVATE